MHRNEGQASAMLGSLLRLMNAQPRYCKQHHTCTVLMLTLDINDIRQTDKSPNQHPVIARVQTRSCDTTEPDSCFELFIGPSGGCRISVISLGLPRLGVCG